MTSAIDATKPTAVTALTADVRAQFATAAAEISALQATAATFPQSLFNNLTLAASIAGNALTIAIKTSAGGDPSTASPVRIAFRNASVATGDYTVVAITTANSLTISSGSTLGAGALIPGRLWIVAFNDGGTVRLGIINCLAFPPDTKTVYPLGQFPIASSTAEGGAGGATSSLVFYTGVAVTSKPYTILGYINYETQLATPGTWNALPDKIQLYLPGVTLPGSLVKIMRAQSGAVGTGTGIIASSDTAPANTSGDVIGVLGITFTPTSACNYAELEASVNCASSSASSIITLGAFDPTSTTAKVVVAEASPGANKPFSLKMRFTGTWLTTAAVPVSLRIGADIASTTTLNGASGARLYGGVYYSFLELREIMG